jgi:hypothetical protein
MNKINAWYVAIIERELHEGCSALLSVQWLPKPFDVETDDDRFFYVQKFKVSQHHLNLTPTKFYAKVTSSKSLFLHILSFLFGNNFVIPVTRATRERRSQNNAKPTREYPYAQANAEKRRFPLSRE